MVSSVWILALPLHPQMGTVYAIAALLYLLYLLYFFLLFMGIAVDDLCD